MSSVIWYPGHAIDLPDIVRAHGAALWDEKGRRYVDLESGVWCTALGHGHPRLLRVLAEQAGRLAHTGYCYTSPVVAEAAAEVLGALGLPGGRCTFLCSGSEAVEYGVRVVRSATDRPRLLTMADSYFGAYGAASRRGGDLWYDFDWTRCAASDAGGCGPSCPHWREIPFDEIGGFLFEPGSSSGLVRFPPAQLVGAIAAEVRSRGGLVLVNEVTTGVGRTGAWFGFQHYPVVPDIVALGKAIGNGYPVAVAAFSATAAAHLDLTPPRWSQSHQNDPLGAAVAREVIHVVREDGLVQRAAAVGVRLFTGLEELRSRSGRISAIRGRGLMLAVELTDAPGAPATARLVRRLRDAGFIVAQRPGLPVLRLDPPLVVDEAYLGAFLGALETALAEAD